MIIAVDGPAGAGKSTVAKILAQKLGFLYIDTGAMYRALTLKAIEEKKDIKDTNSIVEMARNTRIELNNDKGLKVLLDGKDVSLAIRQPRITKVVSDIAKIKEVRQIMLETQRKQGRQQDSVLDGRDIATVVFPDADKKFYIDAKFEERSARRYKELKEKSEDITLDEVKQDLLNRDTIDSTREFAPLKRADDAVYVDTTNLSIDEVVVILLKNVNNVGST
ncbi:MAG: (d)CMP kinase [Candidatus Omnitrophota bacterium]